ncbi:MAG: hypothetical protein C4536_03985 [Actinobacteria bacterium]|jgi:hypothetical protein|nr:MAG: hypothetical protein C4536_03985 [Actinomycetota bacterium]
MESFLGEDSEHDIVIPRHRSFWFYLAIFSIVLLVLAAFAGAGYLVYRIAWGGDESDQDEGTVEDTTQHYTDPELGYGISYPENWSLEPGIPAEGELAALTFNLTSRKNMELRVYQLDPIVSIGGIDAIEEYLVEDATARILALGGQLDAGDASQPSGSRPGYGQEETAVVPPGEGAAPGETEEITSEDMFTSTHISDFPAFYTEFSANTMGEETEFLLYYIVAGDYIFFFQGRAPANEFEDVRPQFFSITRSLTWEDILNDQAPDKTPDISGVRTPVIIFNGSFPRSVGRV